MRINSQYGVTFGALHSWRDLYLAMEDRQEIGSPDPELYLYEVPGRNSPLDCSEALTGRVNYQQRTLKFSFVLREDARQWAFRYSEIASALHGQRMRIVCDDDPYFYYEGRVQIDPVKSSKYLGKIEITAVVDPYKYERFSSVEPWLWDPFDFRVGVIREYGKLTPAGAVDVTQDINAVDGTKALQVIGSPMPVVPTFYAKSSDGDGISVTFNGITYPLYFTDADHTVAGHNVIEGVSGQKLVIISGGVEYDERTGGIRYAAIELTNGTYDLTFTGHGHVAVEYRGGRL